MKRERVLVLCALWATVTFGMAAMPGCYGRNCDGSSGTYGNKPGEGNMIDEDTWESTPIDGKWLHFSSRHIWFFDVPAFGDRKPYDVDTLISPIEEPFVYGPDKPTGNAAKGGGNLSEISGIDRNRVNVANGTCAEYFLHVVVHLPPKGAPVPPIGEGDASVGVVDASTNESDADALDAGTDAEAGP